MKFLNNAIILFFIIVAFVLGVYCHGSVLSCFDNIRRGPSLYIHPFDDYDCLTNDSIDYAVAVKVVDWQSRVNGGLDFLHPLIFEDTDNIYLLPENTPRFQNCSYYAKTKGTIFRKSDGYIWDRSVGLWMPSGFINTNSDDFYPSLPYPVPIYEFEKKWGRGIKHKYYEINPSGLMETRSYICRDGWISIDIKDNLITTNVLTAATERMLKKHAEESLTSSSNSVIPK